MLKRIPWFFLAGCLFCIVHIIMGVFILLVAYAVLLCYGILFAVPMAVLVLLYFSDSVKTIRLTIELYKERKTDG